MAFSYSISQFFRLRPAVTLGLDVPIIKELGLLRRNRYIHKGSGRNFVFHNQPSCSATNIPSLWSPVARLMCHQNAVAPVTINTGNTARSLRPSRGNTARFPHIQQDRFPGMESSLRGVDFNVLRPVQRFTPQSLLKFELFNTQSINNKGTLIEEHIREKGLDFMCLTETWHQPEVYSALNEACPSGYSYLEAARSTGHGGGLAVIHTQDLELSPIPLPATSSCECLAFKFKPPFSMTVLLIYRPPKSNSALIQKYLIWVDTPSCPPAAEFLQLLDSLNLQQHVDVPTHSKGHTLDLVISNSAPISNLLVYNLGVSDHKIVSMELPFPPPYAKPKRQIHFRNLKRINKDALALDLLSSDPTDFLSVADSVDSYNQSLSSLLDLHAPLTSRPVSFSRSAPWYTCELRKMKTAGRVLERRLMASGLTVHKQAYKD